MKHNIRIILDDKSDIYPFKYSVSTLFNIGIEIENSNNESFKILTTNYDEMRNSFRLDYIDKEKCFYDLHTLKILEMFCDKENTYYNYIFNNAEYIILDSDDYLKILNYIKNNKELLNMKILLPHQLKLNNENLESIEKYFKDFNNIYVSTESNVMPINIKDYRKTVEFINEFVLEVESLNLSPLEQIMYVYDKVRNNIYTKEKENESSFESRDLTKVLLGNKIVCVGFSKIFDIILKKLNINTMLYDLNSRDKTGGHERNIAYVKDNKYNVEGIYYFDTTWDSKRKNNDTNYLYGYRFFAKTKKEIEEYSKEVYIDTTFPVFKEEIDLEFQIQYTKKGLLKVDEDLLKTINNLSKLVDGKKIITNKMILPETFPSYLRENFDLCYTLNSIKKYINLMNKPINANILLEVLYNIRKIEYYRDSDKYPFDVDCFYRITKNSHWVFDQGLKKLINVLFEENAKEIYNKCLKNDMIKFIKQKELDKKIAQVKLTKTLKKVLNKKMRDEL